MDLGIENLSKTYPNGVQALKNINLTVPPGMFGLLGPNGAGKSTLMRTIATLQEADRGEIRFNGIDVLRQKDRVRRILGYLPQEFGLDPKVSAEALLSHFAALKGISHSGERRAAVDALLRQTNLYEHRKRKLGGFSGGMKQRFGIAQALLGEPQLIIVDEPTAGLDPEERLRFLNLLSDLGQNIVVILSTHIVDDVAQLCSSMAVIHQGEVLMAGRPQEAVAQLRGRIWQKAVGKADLPAIQAAYPTLATRLLAGRTVVRVYSESPPDPGFEVTEPNLEDVYFVTIRPDRNGRMS